MCIVGNRISREQINCRLESIRAIQIKNRQGFTKEFQPWDALLISRFNIVQSKDIFNVNRFFFGINKYHMWSCPLLEVRKNTLKISFHKFHIFLSVPAVGEIHQRRNALQRQFFWLAPKIVQRKSGRYIPLWIDVIDPLRNGGIGRDVLYSVKTKGAHFPI